jgi:vancomycin resistance protein YoaR
MKKILQNFGGIKIAIMAVAFACLGAAAFFGVQMFFQPKKIISGVAVWESDLSGLTREEGEGKLLLLEKEIVQSTPLVLRYDARAWQLQPGRIGLAIDREKVLDEALMLGRRGPVAQRWEQWRLARREGIKVPLYVKIDKSRLESELKAIASEITVPPRDAQLKINPDETVEVIPSRNGIIVDSQKVFRDIVEVFKNYESAPEVYLALIKAGPQKTTQDVLDMGVNGLLSSFSTAFDPGDADRSYNIKVAAAALDGQLIPPSGDFSFNDVVGPRSSEAGYKNAKVIINNELVDGLGGGVCQVSSTLYNAVLLANLQILDRTNHSIPVSYVLPGRDATVVYDYIDFRFKNTTPFYLYLKTAVKPGRVTVKIYGSRDWRREVTIRTKVVETISFKEVHLEDPSLKEGEIEIKSKGSPGLRVVAERVILGGDGDAKVDPLPSSLYHPVDKVIITAPAQPDTPAGPADPADPAGGDGSFNGGIVPPPR